ncbi:uncharacterized protein CDAR_116761 [Caerostris darwini]|uniref:Uncharacterized protein n=1 Tax=Caerostris darwini TaxID=1538125 RepID=A0AAV4W902_9ARAC|nr:uncharacterized protein CDAR_116761 [Caerostris darwini]
MDTELSIFVFSSTVYNACAIYFVIVALIHPDEYFDILQNVSIWCLFVASFVSYFSLVLSGSFVHEATEDLWLKAHEVLATKKDITSFQAQLLSIVDKKLHLTVWKTVPIKRSFILTMVGTVLTYCLLLDGLRSNDKLPHILSI